MRSSRSCSLVRARRGTKGSCLPQISSLLLLFCLASHLVLSASDGHWQTNVSQPQQLENLDYLTFASLILQTERQDKVPDKKEQGTC